jgi:sarcosine oxidase subunit alpha
MPDTRIPVARTPLHHWHQAHGARFAERDGWQVVAAYSSADTEASAARAGVGLADVSASAKVSVRGPGVASVLAALAPDTAALRPRGVMPLPGQSALACRLTDEHLLLLDCAPALSERLAALCQGRDVVITDVTCAYVGFELVGPRLDDLLCRLTHLDVRPTALPAGSCAETSFAGVEALLVRAGGRSLPALRVYVAWDLGQYVWERIMEAGHGGPVVAIGQDALQSL